MGMEFLACPNDQSCIIAYRVPGGRDPVSTGRLTASTGPHQQTPTPTVFNECGMQGKTSTGNDISVEGCECISHGYLSEDLVTSTLYLNNCILPVVPVPVTLFPAYYPVMLRETVGFQDIRGGLEQGIRVVQRQSPSENDAG